MRDICNQPKFEKPSIPGEGNINKNIAFKTNIELVGADEVILKLKEIRDLVKEIRDLLKEINGDESEAIIPLEEMWRRCEGSKVEFK